MTINYANNEFGDVKHNDRIVHLTQQAYLAGTKDQPVYRANGVDDEGNDYRVTWTPYDNFMEFDDESDCCDWDKYTVSKE